MKRKYKASLPPLKVLKETFELSEDSPTGLIWKLRPTSHFSSQHAANKTNSLCAGKVAGSLRTGDIRWVVNVFGRLYRAHRIVYFLHHGRSPGPLTVDHIDGDGTNNRIGNLRLATKAQNNRNSKKPSTNTTGFKGIFPRGKRWRAKVTLDGKPYFFGTHDTKEQAHAAYVEGARKLHGQFHRAS